MMLVSFLSFSSLLFSCPLCTVLHPRFTLSLWFETCRFIFRVHSVGSLVVDIISVSFSLSSPPTDVLLAPCCPPSTKPDEVSAFAIFPSFWGIFCFCSLKVCWGQEDCSKPLRDTVKLKHHVARENMLSLFISANHIERGLTLLKATVNEGLVV